MATARRSVPPPGSTTARTTPGQRDWTLRGSVLEQAVRLADADGPQLAGLDQPVHGRRRDTQVVGHFLRRQEPGLRHAHAATTPSTPGPTTLPEDRPGGER